MKAKRDGKMAAWAWSMVVVVSGVTGVRGEAPGKSEPVAVPTAAGAGSGGVSAEGGGAGGAAGVGVATDGGGAAQLAPLTVLGEREAMWEQVGSAAYVDMAEMRERGYLNIKKVADAVPGVYIRDEDGYGNFPNISIRGVDGSRSQKVTLMEDGILTAPAPYAAPAAYYTPKVGRMAGVEFLKGSSQVRFGPQTTGGVVNFLSTPIPAPDGRVFFSRMTYGSENTFFNQTWYGDQADTPQGRVGWLLEGHVQTTDGFRELDGGGRDSGFELYEPMLKLAFEPNGALKQRLEMKVGFGDFDANETYSGIAVDDLRRNPDRRYVSSRFDHHRAEHLRSYLKWVGEPSDILRVESAMYYNSFRRSWDKLDGLSRTTRTNIGEALMDSTALQVLKGLGPGNAITRDAFREYELYGWQNQANVRFATGELSHDLAVGLRLHSDRVAGTNQATSYASNLAGGFGPGVEGPVGYAGTAEVDATAVYLEDEVVIGALKLRPGVRYEYLDVQNRTASGLYRSAAEELVMGGMGGSYELDTCNSLFAGIYQGASPANPGGYVSGADSETSLGYELGVRHQREHLSGELVAFFTDFDDLIAPEVGVGGGGLAPSQNAGAAEVWGLEGLLRYDHGRACGMALGTPVYASATYTHARFDGISGRLGNAAGLFAGAVDGAEIPYVPEWKLGVGAGLEGEKWGVYLDLSYVSSTWGTGYNGRTRLNDSGTPATATAVDGRIDALLLFDLTAHYQLNDHWKLVGGIHNLFDEQEIVTRAPLGPRANAPRSLFLGCEATF